MNCFFCYWMIASVISCMGATGRFSNPERMVCLLLLNRFNAMLIFSDKINNSA